VACASAYICRLFFQQATVGVNPASDRGVVCLIEERIVVQVALSSTSRGGIACKRSPVISSDTSSSRIL
jgi:hypothetical protein